MKGFRDTGRGGGSSKGDEGEAARLRKGLLDERLILRPADGSSPCWNEPEADMLGDCLLGTGMAMCQTGVVVGVFWRVYLCLCIKQGRARQGQVVEKWMLQCNTAA
jgi:hypothetical protein